MSGPPPTDSRGFARPWRPATALALAMVLLLPAAGLFLPALGFPFLDLDDDWFVLANPTIRDLSWKGVLNLFLGEQHDFRYFPVTYLSFAIDLRLFGLDASALHRSGVLLHLLNTVLVAALVRCLGWSVACALMTAGLFSIHPLQVEPVCWVMGRKDVLFFFFYLLSVLAWLGHLDRRDAGRVGKNLFFAASVVLFALSILAKFSAVSLPLVLMLVERMREDGRKGDTLAFARRSLPTKLPYFALAAMAWFLNEQTATRSPFQWTPGFSAVEQALLVGHNFFVYLVKAVAPLDLAVFHAQPTPGAALPVHFALFSAGAIATGLFGALLWRKDRPLGFGLAWYAVAIAPTALLPVLTRDLPILWAERYFYAAAPGVFLVVATGLERVWRSRRFQSPPLRAALVALVLAAFASLYAEARTMVATWSSSVALFEQVARADPSDEFWYRLAFARQDAGDLDGALAALDEGRSAGHRVFFSRVFHFQYRVAMLERRAGHPKEALQWMEAAIESTPNRIEPVGTRCPMLYLEMADLHTRLGDASGAVEAAERARVASCDGEAMHARLLFSYAADEADDLLRRRTREHPQDGMGWWYLGALEEFHGNGPSAEELRQRALTLGFHR